MDCKFSRQLSAYHDGELRPAECEALGAHLAQCAECRSELEQLRALSRLVADAATVPLPQGLLERAHERVDSAGEVVVVRLAERLMAAAAAVLLACGLYLWQAGRAEVAPPLETWAPALISQRLPAPQEPGAEDPLVRWVVADLEQGEQQ
jgi:anti-sigma factor RsiW